MLKGQRNHKTNYFYQGLDDLLGQRTNIGIKRMGDLDQKPFLNTCKQRFPLDEAQLQASTLCSLWQEHLKNPDWHPFKIIHVNGHPQVLSFRHHSINFSYHKAIVCNVLSEID